MVASGDGDSFSSSSPAPCVLLLPPLLLFLLLDLRRRRRRVGGWAGAGRKGPIQRAVCFCQSGNVCVVVRVRLDSNARRASRRRRWWRCQSPRGGPRGRCARSWRSADTRDMARRAPAGSLTTKMFPCSFPRGRWENRAAWLAAIAARTTAIWIFPRDYSYM